MNKVIESFKMIIEKSEELYGLAMFDKRATWEELEKFINLLEDYTQLKKENNINNNIDYYEDIDKLRNASKRKDYLEVIDCIKFEMQPKFTKEF